MASRETPPLARLSFDELLWAEDEGAGRPWLALSAGRGRSRSPAASQAGAASGESAASGAAIGMAASGAASGESAWQEPPGAASGMAASGESAAFGAAASGESATSGESAASGMGASGAAASGESVASGMAASRASVVVLRSRGLLPNDSTAGLASGQQQRVASGQQQRPAAAPAAHWSLHVPWAPPLSQAEKQARKWETSRGDAADAMDRAVQKWPGKINCWPDLLDIPEAELLRRCRLAVRAALGVRGQAAIAGHGVPLETGHGRVYVGSCDCPTWRWEGGFFYRSEARGGPGQRPAYMTGHCYAYNRMLVLGAWQDKETSRLGPLAIEAARVAACDLGKNDLVDNIADDARGFAVKGFHHSFIYVCSEAFAGFLAASPATVPVSIPRARQGEARRRQEQG